MLTETKTKAPPATPDAWRGFKSGLWQRDVNVRWFLQSHYTPYDGDGAFLAGASKVNLFRFCLLRAFLRPHRWLEVRKLPAIWCPDAEAVAMAQGTSTML